MDGQRFDDLAKFLSVSLNRKRFLAVLAGIAAPASLPGGTERVAAKKSGRRHRKKRREEVGPEGQDGVCGATCTITADCAACPTGRCAMREDGSRECGTLCQGNFCSTDAQCASAISDNCECANSTCVCFDGDCGPACGATCEDDGDCTGCPFGACVGNVCLSSCPVSCEVDGDCASISPDCVCDEGNNCDCPNGCGFTCPGRCSAFGDCGPGCFCADAVCETCDGACQKDADCPGFDDLQECTCTIPAGAVVGTCGTPGVCPGLCADSALCQELGGDECVCFLGAGVDVAAAVQGEGVPPTGECGGCLGVNAACDASTECCGQLVCDGGNCRRKRKPNPRCHPHGGSCQRDNDCCAQGVCYKGRCGEKDTHCRNDGECAQGYRCQGGPLAPGHRRCRKNGRRTRNRRNARGKKR